MPAHEIIVPARRGRTPKRSKNDRAGEHYHLKVIGRALDVLDSFSDERPDLNLKQIGALVDAPESSLFRILLTLENRGYLVQSPDGSYRLAPKLLLGKVHERAERLRLRLRPLLERLAGQ